MRTRLDEIMEEELAGTLLPVSPKRGESLISANAFVLGRIGDALRRAFQHGVEQTGKAFYPYSDPKQFETLFVAGKPVQPAPAAAEEKPVPKPVLEFHLDGRATVDGEPWLGGVLNFAHAEHTAILAGITLNRRQGERRSRTACEHVRMHEPSSWGRRSGTDRRKS